MTFEVTRALGSSHRTCVSISFSPRHAEETAPWGDRRIAPGAASFLNITEVAPGPERDELSSNRRPALSFVLSPAWMENRVPLFLDALECTASRDCTRHDCQVRFRYFSGPAFARIVARSE